MKASKLKEQLTVERVEFCNIRVIAGFKINILLNVANPYSFELQLVDKLRAVQLLYKNSPGELQGESFCELRAVQALNCFLCVFVSRFAKD